MPELDLLEKQIANTLPFYLDAYLTNETKKILWRWVGDFKFVYESNLEWEILPEYRIVSYKTRKTMYIKVRFTRKSGLLFKKERSIDVWIHEDNVMDDEIAKCVKREVSYFKCGNK